jgi:hypothetical protein
MVYSILNLFKSFENQAKKKESQQPVTNENVMNCEESSNSTNELITQTKKPGIEPGFL